MSDNSNAGATGWFLLGSGEERMATPFSYQPILTVDGPMTYTYSPAAALAWVRDGVLPDATPAPACGMTMREALEVARGTLKFIAGQGSRRGIINLALHDLARVTAALAALDEAQPTTTPAPAKGEGEAK